jgi:hypothetical protein
MHEINFNNKTFALISNSEKGKVNDKTIFKYKQEGSLVTADYYGGAIRYGKIIAVLKESQLHMLYQCLTMDNELKAGKALAEISFTENDKIKLKLNWEWLEDKSEKGISEYIEI